MCTGCHLSDLICIFFCFFFKCIYYNKDSLSPSLFASLSFDCYNATVHFRLTIWIFAQSRKKTVRFFSNIRVNKQTHEMKWNNSQYVVCCVLCARGALVFISKSVQQMQRCRIKCDQIERQIVNEWVCLRLLLLLLLSVVCVCVIALRMGNQADRISL